MKFLYKLMGWCWHDYGMWYVSIAKVHRFNGSTCNQSYQVRQCNICKYKEIEEIDP